MRTSPGELVQKTVPYKHQMVGLTASWRLPYYGIFWDMGVGKSKTILDTAQWLYQSQEIDGLLLISDKGCYTNWMREEVQKHVADEVPCRVAEWSSSMNKRDQQIFDIMCRPKDDCLDIVTMNVEAFSGDRAFEEARKFILTHYTMIVVDEATSIKNIKAQRTKNLIRLSRMCDYRRILTGTPVTQGPLDLYSMCEFLNQGCLGFSSFVAFRNYYCVLQRRYMGPNRPSFDEVIGYKNMEELSRRLMKFSSRITKAECLDLPPKVYERVNVELSTEQRAAYDSLKSTAVVQLEQGLLTSTLALTTMNKLQQICCGHVKLDDGTVVDLPNARVPTLVEIVQKIPGKVIVWCAYQRDVELVMGSLTCAGISAVHYYGKTISSERVDALDSFKHGEVKVFVGTAATGGKGINLTEANYVIYYSSTYSLEDRLQSEDRAHRIGQVNKVTYIDLVATGTVDERIHEALKRKEDLSHVVLDKFRELVAP